MFKRRNSVLMPLAYGVAFFSFGWVVYLRLILVIRGLAPGGVVVPVLARTDSLRTVAVLLTAAVLAVCLAGSFVAGKIVGRLRDRGNSVVVLCLVALLIQFVAVGSCVIALMGTPVAGRIGPMNGFDTSLAIVDRPSPNLVLVWVLAAVGSFVGAVIALSLIRPAVPPPKIE